jgi:hypothetical protein
MKKNLIFLGIFMVFLLASLCFFYAKSAIIEASSSESTLTKAICNEKNYCEDYQITCNGKDVTRLTPTGAAVQFSEDWKDPRTEKDKIIGCE